MKHPENSNVEIFFSEQNSVQNKVKSSINTKKLNADLPAIKKIEIAKQLIENEPRAAVMLDQDGTIILIEGTHLEEFGLDKYELIGNSIHIANAEKPLLLKTISKAVLKEERAACFELNNTTYQVNLMPIWKNNREISGQIIIVTDVTALSRSLEYGGAQDSFYRQLFDNMKDAVALLDRDEKIIDVNSSFENMFGFRKNEILGKTINPLIVPPELIEEIADMELIIEHGETAQFESRRKTADGKEIELLITGSKIITANGETGFCRIYSDISAKKNEEEKMRSSQLEKELLLKEIHHRVKNNLQVISSLVLMQAQSIKDKRTADVLLTTQNRVKSISMIHEKLYHTVNLSRIDFDKYLKSLIPQLMKSYNVNQERIEINVNAENIFLNTDTAIPCALIINELVSNSIKHAFPFERNGKIDIKLKYHNNNKITLTISDDGVGIKQKSKEGAIGLQLLGALVKQLNAKMDIEDKNGMHYKINFSLE